MKNRRLESISDSPFKPLSAKEQAGIVGALGPTPTVGLTKEPTFLNGHSDQTPDYVRDA
jgi:hypothetical protein